MRNSYSMCMVTFDLKVTAIQYTPMGFICAFIKGMSLVWVIDAAFHTLFTISCMIQFVLLISHISFTKNYFTVPITIIMIKFWLMISFYNYQAYFGNNFKGFFFPHMYHQHEHLYVTRFGKTCIGQTSNFSTFVSHKIYLE